MGRLTNALRGASAPRDAKDAAAAIKRVHGRGASRWLAQQAGISQRQAQRRLSGQAASGRGRGPQVEDLAEPEALSAEALMSATAIDAGHVDVTYNGKSQGTRKVGLVNIDGALKGELTEVANMLMDGDDAGAEQALSDALLGAYTARTGGDRDQLKGTLNVSSFRTGFHIL